MRPDILNPLFAEVEALKGVGPQLAKPLSRLGLSRAIDLLFHLPAGFVDRKAVTELDEADVGQIVTVTVTPTEYRMSGSARAPARVVALDAAGNAVSLVFFGGSSGWARKQLPLGEPKAVSGKLDRYDQWLQIVHPEVMTPEEAKALPAREAVYALSEGLTNKRLAAMIAQAIARMPDCPNGSNQVSSPNKAGRAGARR